MLCCMRHGFARATSSGSPLAHATENSKPHR
jgi:hypothetical protein